MPTFIQIIAMGIALGSAAGSALGAFFAVGKVSAYVAAIFRRRYEAKILKAMGVELPSAEGDDEQLMPGYSQQNWRDAK